MTTTAVTAADTATAAAEAEEETALGVSAAWLERFAAAVHSPAHEDIDALLTPDVTWRDFLAFTWGVTNHVGLKDVRSALGRLSADVRPHDLSPAVRQAPIRTDDGVLMFFEFATEHRRCSGFARLTLGGDGRWQAATLMTQAEGLTDFPAAVGAHRPEGKAHGYVPGRTRWSDDRAAESEFENDDPQVVVLGAGHNGLSVAARLASLNVSTLVVERNERVGDNWRKRYASLALHSLLNADHLPFYPFPPTWTAHTPKDKFADHLESYARAMDLNVWTGTELTGAAYDDADGRWTITLRRPGGERTLRPVHLVLAVGLNGKPRMPEVPGLAGFQGVAVHSGEFQGGSEWDGKRVLVVGAAVSGHEISHDLYEHGARVTMLQRNATYVIDFQTFNDLFYGVYAEGSGLGTEFADMVAYATPNIPNRATLKELVTAAAERDRDLLDRLRQRGFKLEWGPDGTGIIGSHMAGRDSYQINIGASELIADGHIGVKQGVEIDRATPTGVVFTDGTAMDVDLIVFATGYESMDESVHGLLGPAAAKVQKVYGLADDGEYSEAWRRSRQPGLWFATGFVTMARFYSRSLTMLIKAIETGLTPKDPGA
ncbi:NAD(P)/FAD-dependent oxidoreductase [Actinomadura barringtoniae]|uniref:NAD(P)/FAD-dependent oxidoreductase n=1 Tax=Actinomadura barringtoniae TaxID=1427535 RepID=A0A939PN86_9ACTN|nr:NAD(P)/FAD-dependent oxidoreductase [Actinomadura barringtoniae]MBO2453183.1 NAD(P)/FAD-dependent oxidoreductase [Actinomadura barringtoniae]